MGTNSAACLYKFFIGNTLKETTLRVIITSASAAITGHLAHSFRNLLDPQRASWINGGVAGTAPGNCWPQVPESVD